MGKTDETMVYPATVVDNARRTLYIVGEISDATTARVLPALFGLDQTDGDIRIVLSSEGGTELDGYAIYDAITMCRNKVVIDVFGQALSIAAAILQAGDLRRMAPNADFMIHNGVVGGDEEMKQDAILEMADQIKRDTQKYYDILSIASQQPQEVIADWCRGETYFSAREAVDAGFIDEVIEPLKFRGPKPRKRKKKS
jgi:ATP-dependent Clp protease protease subunit